MRKRSAATEKQLQVVTTRRKIELADLAVSSLVKFVELVGNLIVICWSRGKFIELAVDRMISFTELVSWSWSHKSVEENADLPH